MCLYICEHANGGATRDIARVFKFFFIEAKGHVANDDADSGDSSLATVSIIHDQLRRIYNSTSQRRKRSI